VVGSRSQFGLDVSLEDAQIQQRAVCERRCERVAARAGDEGLRIQRPTGAFERSPGASGNDRVGVSSCGGSGGSDLVQDDQSVRLKPYPRLTNANLFFACLF
jgi:hypothetical protein